MRMFVAALLIIAQIWKQPQCPSTIVCIKSVYSYSGIFYNEINTLKLDAATESQTLNTIFFFFLPYHMIYGILVPQPRLEPVPLEVKVQSLNHWTTREIPRTQSTVYVIMYHFIKESKPGRFHLWCEESGWDYL